MRNVIDKDLGLKRFKAELEKAKVATVLIGVHQGDMNGGKSIAEYGAYNEFGTSSIPDRSFMRTSFDENNSRISRDIEREYNKLKLGSTDVYTALSLIGLRHSDDIKRTITYRNILPALAPSTVKRKGSSKTLIDSGALRKSIHHVVKMS